MSYHSKSLESSVDDDFLLPAEAFTSRRRSHSHIQDFEHQKWLKIVKNGTTEEQLVEDVVHDEEVDSLKCHKFKYASKEKILRRLLFQNQFYETFFMDIFPKFMKPTEVLQFLIETYEDHCEMTNSVSNDDNSPVTFTNLHDSPLSLEREIKGELIAPTTTSNSGSLTDISTQCTSSDPISRSPTSIDSSSTTFPTSSSQLMRPKENKLKCPTQRSMIDLTTSSSLSPTSLRHKFSSFQSRVDRRSVISINSNILEDMDKLSFDSNMFSEFASHRKVDFSRYGARIHPSKQVLRLLYLWMNDYFEDFHHDPSLVSKFNEFYEQLLTKYPMEFDLEVKKLKRIYTTKLTEYSKIRAYSKPEYVNSFSEFKPEYFAKCQPESVALGFAMIDCENWCALKPRDLIDENYRSHKNRASIVRIYNCHDQLYTRIFATIAFTQSKSDRAKKFRFWTKVAESLVRHKNYNSSIAIYKSLSGCVINKMPLTSAKLSKKSIESMERLKVILGSSEKLKNDLRSLAPPYIPFLNDIANSLLALEQCYKDDSNKTMIDLRICYAISSLISNVRKQKSYRLESYLSYESYSMIKGFYKFPCPSADYIFEHLDDKEKLVITN